MTPSDARPYLWMLGGSFSFAAMAVLTESLTRRPTPDTPPLCDWQTVVVVRAALVTLFAAVLARQARVRLVWLRPGRLWLRSVAGSFSMVCTFYAFGHLPSDAVVTLTNTFPIWVSILSWPLYGQAPGAKTAAAVVVGVVGVVLTQQPHFEGANLAVIAALGAAWFTAVAMLGLNRLRDVDPRAVVVHFSAVATAVAAAAFLLTPRAEPLARAAEPAVLLTLAGIGLSATVGQVFLTLAFGRGAPAKVSVVGLMQIVFVLVMCVCAFGRAVNATALLGTALVVAPTAWLLTRPKGPAAAGSEPAAPPQAADRPDSAEEGRPALAAPPLRP
jgi:drug/metabolite transporter (DMT)-like permease